jgi:hypothetical protein
VPVCLLVIVERWTWRQFLIPQTLVFCLGLPSSLEDSGAFEVVHAELDSKGEPGANQGVVLLKSTGRAPETVPTRMDANTMLQLRRCEQANGPEYAKRIKARFPNGILNKSE